MRKVVVRLLGAANELLGWVEHEVRVPGDGKLWPSGPITVRVDQKGYPTTVSIHWCTVNVETRVPVPEVCTVVPGQIVQLYDGSVPLISVGNRPYDLPPVIVGRPVSISPPVGKSFAVPPGTSLLRSS
jgi:hypothetical protein